MPSISHISSPVKIVFNMSIKNYFIATLIGIVPVSFISVALGSGIEKFIEQNTELSFKNIIFSPEIYFPILGFFIWTANPALLPVLAAFVLSDLV